MGKGFNCGSHWLNPKKLTTMKFAEMELKPEIINCAVCSDDISGINL